MSPKDLFQTSVRVAGVVFLFFSVPRAVSDLLTAFTGGGGGLVIGLVFRLLWEIVVPIWLICGARCLTRRIYGTE